MSVDMNNVELSRMRWGAIIVGASIVAAIAALLIVTSHLTREITATDMVALMGTVTTFLGLAVGILFGVNAGNSARANATEATTQMSEAASKVADAAKTATDSAQLATETAARAIDASHTAMRELVSQQRALRALPADAVARGEPEEDVEDLAGDPDDIHTRTVLPTERGLDSFTRGVVNIANPAPAEALFAKGVLGVAEAEAAAGVSRSSNKARVTEYLKLLGFEFLDAHGVPTRYCAAGLTWAACKAYCQMNNIAFTPDNELAIFRSVLGDIGRHYFKPSAGCQVIMNDAKARGSFLPASKRPLPGYLVFYNWEGGGHAQHIGLVQRADSGDLRTVEFNTTVASGPNQGDGGAVATKTRALKFVLGYAQTY
ncbi:hypothetical protein SAMN02745157_4969 [Kaistia soli DSM 19436]|uniref:CHAP domain-containing protein n=2 Tax=Kaistia TaxID=166953 RepID=A0A1M5NAG9_9HYPH|nr:hypothetical protein SAMN02745157_4969 [Kaistia soli DSM 19436]